MRKPRKTVKGPVRAAGSAGGSTGAAGRGARGGGKRGIGPGKARGIKPPRHPHGTVKGTAGPKGGSAGPAGKSAPKAAPKKRQYSPGSDVACCSAQALGTLLGWDWDQVLALYWRTAAGPDSGATILDTLEAARLLPRACYEVGDGNEGSRYGTYQDEERADLNNACPRFAHPGVANPVDPPSHGLILGVSLPEPHAVAVTPDGRWWSWGQPFNPGDWPDLVIEEAWAVGLG